jgi:hypothetical protein
MFITAPASYARLLEAGARHMKDKGHRGEAAKYVFIYGVAMPMIFQAVADAMIGFDGDDEDKEKFWGDQRKAVASAYLNGIPFMRDIQSGAWNIIEGNGWYGTEITPMLEIYNEWTDMFQASLNAYQGGSERISAKEYASRAAQHLAHFIGYATGVPTKPISRWGEGIRDVATGEAEKPVRALMGYSRWARGGETTVERYNSRSTKILSLVKEESTARENHDAKKLREIRSHKDYRYIGVTKSIRKRVAALNKRKKMLEKRNLPTDSIERQIEREMKRLPDGK